MSHVLDKEFAKTVGHRLTSKRVNELVNFTEAHIKAHEYAVISNLVQSAGKEWGTGSSAYRSLKSLAESLND